MFYLFWLNQHKVDCLSQTLIIYIKLQEYFGIIAILIVNSYGLQVSRRLRGEYKNYIQVSFALAYLLSSQLYRRITN